MRQAVTNIRRFSACLLVSASAVAACAVIVAPTTRGGDTPAGPIENDALNYLAMVTGPVTAAPAPFCFRVGAPLLARALPMSPEAGLATITLLSLVLAGALWVYVGLRLGYSRAALAIAALAACSTQGWLQNFNNPYLTDGAGLLGVVAAGAAWMFDAYWVALVVLAIAPLARETVGPMALLWGLRSRLQLALALSLAGAPLALVHLWPGMPQGEGVLETLRYVLEHKGLVRILADALASHHALWLAGAVGLSLAPARRRQLIGPPLVLMLVVALGLSLIALNTVRMFTLALPFVAYAVAEFTEALLSLDKRLAGTFGAALALGPWVWFPTRWLGGTARALKPAQYVFAGLCVVVVLWAWRRVVRGPVDRPLSEAREPLPGRSHARAPGEERPCNPDSPTR